MAKIKGVELKSITKFKGHEGETLVEGNIYLDGKKIGFFSQDVTGGDPQIDINDENNKNQFHERVIEYFKNSKEPSFLHTPIIFLEELAQFSLLEKGYKQWVKKGYYALVDNPEPRETFVVPKSSFEDTRKEYPKAKVYTSLEDFIIS